MLTEEKPGQLEEKELEARSKNTEALYWAAPCPGPDSSPCGFQGFLRGSLKSPIDQTEYRAHGN